MDRSARLIIKGMMILCLALLMWRLTHNVWGWLVFFLPGSGIMLYGIYRGVVMGRD
jgi:hypothetical protein